MVSVSGVEWSRGKTVCFETYGYLSEDLAGLMCCCLHDMNEVSPGQTGEVSSWKDRHLIRPGESNRTEGQACCISRSYVEMCTYNVHK